MSNLLDEIKADRAIGTPDHGGWGWYGGRDNVMLAANRGGRQFVMNFARKGMWSAQPCFHVRGLMVGAIDALTTYEVGNGTARGQVEATKDATVYRLDISGIDHPDARRMTRIPEMERALLAAGELADALQAMDECEDGALADTAYDDLMARLAAFRRACDPAADWPADLGAVDVG